MRIGIDYTAAVQQRAGIGRYTRELVRAISWLDQANRYVLLQAARGAKVAAGSWPANFDVHSLPLTDHQVAVLWQRFRLPLPVELVAGRIAVFHSPDFVLPPTWRARTVLTVHDLSFLTTPHTADPALRRYLMASVPRSIARADHILADSESTRRDLVQHLGVEPERTTVVYPGVGSQFKPLELQAVREVRARYKLEGPFVLAVGTLQPRKNYPALIEAWARLREVDPALASVGLVIAGGRGWLYDEIDATIERLEVATRVRLLGFVPEEDLPALYNAAAAVAMPSLYEGFGIPVIEALACGTPVVASNVSSLPEASGDAALLVPPDDVDALAKALRRLLTDDELRATLRQRGFAHAQHFTWEAAARTVLNVYSELADTSRRGRSRHHSMSIF